MNKLKAKALTIMFVMMLLAILDFIALSVHGAWKVYGILFGSLGVIYFTQILYRWIRSEDGRDYRAVPKSITRGRHNNIQGGDQ